jgi:hypothetical protein
MSAEPVDMKDVYAQFGVTFSHGCNIENILANIIVTSDFVKMVAIESKKAGKPIYDRYETVQKFDEYLAKQHGKTMGALVGGPKRPGGIKDFVQLDPALEKRVDDALRRRNYLAHDFWRERGLEAISAKRRNPVFADLQADQRFFEELTTDLEALALDEVRKIGLDADKLKTNWNASVERVQRELAR